MNSPSIPASGCRYTWCQTLHSSGPGLGHQAALGSFEGPGRVQALFIQPETNGWFDEPFVRIVYTLNGRELCLEISPQAAADLADVLGGLSDLGRDNLTAAFAAADRLRILPPSQMPGDLDQAHGGTA
ncbi:hypothetical protein [Streptosporangium saharense]|uniref:hypothetical protein n=1 Tax=Streptosporangium saharense TaxID=1706840 RepID=UPI003423C7C3